MEILLHNAELMAIPGRRTGLRVSCGAGHLWVTQQGDLRDHLLGTGESFTSRLTGEIVVTALATSRLSLLPGGRLVTENPKRKTELLAG